MPFREAISGGWLEGYLQYRFSRLPLLSVAPPLLHYLYWFLASIPKNTFEMELVSHGETLLCG